MPHLTMPLSPGGSCLVHVGVGVTRARAAALESAKQTVPDIQVANALIDTGASITALDHSIIRQLRLSPTGTTSVHTPSTTGGNPDTKLLYDVTIILYHAQHQYIMDRAVPVTECALKHQGIDVLLGTDILKDCLMIYDGCANTFILSF